MSKESKITALMSVYNGQKYLDQCIESILIQSYKNFEFLIIDDASTDLTSKILKKYSQKDQRLKVSRNEKNIGLTKSLNKGLNKALGEYVARMDADDISLPTRFEQQVAYLDNNINCALVGCWTKIIDDNNKVIKVVKLKTNNKDIKSEMLIANHFTHGSVMMRKKCLDKTGYYNNDLVFSQDYDLWLRVSEKYKIANIPKFLYLWRNNTSNISTINEEQQKNIALSVKRKFIQSIILKKPNHFQIIKSAVKINPSDLVLDDIFKKICIKESRKKELFFHTLQKLLYNLKQKIKKYLKIILTQKIITKIKLYKYE